MDFSAFAQKLEDNPVLTLPVEVGENFAVSCSYAGRGFQDIKCFHPLIAYAKRDRSIGDNAEYCIIFQLNGSEVVWLSGLGVFRPTVESYWLIKSAFSLYGQLSSQFHVIDLGAGCGIVGCDIAATMKPGRITFVECSASALELCRLNSQRFDNTDIRVDLCKALQDVTTDSALQAIVVSNPPYFAHNGDFILQDWIQQAGGVGWPMLITFPLREIDKLQEWVLAAGSMMRFLHRRRLPLRSKPSWACDRAFGSYHRVGILLIMPPAKMMSRASGRKW